MYKKKRREIISWILLSYMKFQNHNNWAYIYSKKSQQNETQFSILSSSYFSLFRHPNYVCVPCKFKIQQIYIRINFCYLSTSIVDLIRGFNKVRKRKSLSNTLICYDRSFIRIVVFVKSFNSPYNVLMRYRRINNV